MVVVRCTSSFRGHLPVVTPHQSVGFEAKIAPSSTLTRMEILSSLVRKDVLVAVSELRLSNGLPQSGTSAEDEARIPVEGSRKKLIEPLLIPRNHTLLS